MNELIKNVILESFNGLTISREEAINDWETLNNDDSLPTKKAIAAKYGIVSKKIKEIQNTILLYLRELRKTQTSFDKSDVRFFDRLGGYDSYKKEAEMFDQEPKGFLEFLLNYRLDLLKKDKLDCYIGWNLSQLRYRISMHDLYTLAQYGNIKRYFEEHSQEHIEKVDVIKTIYDKLSIELKDFKDEYIKRVADAAIKFYNNLPALQDSLYKKYEELYKEYQEWWNENRSASWDESSKMSEPYEKVWAAYVKNRMILEEYKTVDEYKNKEVETAERNFDNDVMAIAERINKQDLDVTKMKVTQVGWDAKFFELMITDGTKKLYARSIWAAANSTYMVPHYRFIITDRSKF